MAFEVTIDSTNSPVNSGDTLEVNYTVTNTGDTSDTQTVELVIGGYGVEYGASYGN